MTAIQIALETLNREKGKLAAEIEMLRAADKVRVTVHEAEIRRLAIECGKAKDEIERLRTAPWVFRCSCQIADVIAPDCAARGWCKERRALETKP